MFVRILLMIVTLSMLCCCNSKRAEQMSVVSSLMGREIVMPENLTIHILNDTIDFSLGDADYTIVAYIDSAGCTPCRMKLKDWDKLINQLKTIPEVDLAFVMVINSSDTTKLNHIIKRNEFLHPICYDPGRYFAIRNQLPETDAHHTFLLDANNEIVLVGNPAINPKIRELYKRVISGDITDDVNTATKPLGAISIGDSIMTRFEVHNSGTEYITVQELMPSCDCISASINLDTIQPGKFGILSVKYIADSITGPTSRHVDVYFNEKEKPERYIVHGYVINTKNNSQKNKQ